LQSPAPSRHDPQQHVRVPVGDADRVVGVPVEQDHAVPVANDGVRRRVWRELDDDGLCPDCDLGGETTDDDSPDKPLDEEVE